MKNEAKREFMRFLTQDLGLEFTSYDHFKTHYNNLKDKYVKNKKIREKSGEGYLERQSWEEDMFLVEKENPKINPAKKVKKIELKPNYFKKQCFS